MGTNFIFRDFSDDDYEALLRLWEQTGLGSGTRGDDLATIRRSIGMGGKLILMIESASGKLAGTSWMTYDGRRIHLHHFGIDPGFQGRKLSKALLEESLKFAREMRTQIKLEVHEDNLKAVSLYKKNGFKYLGAYRIYIIRDISDIPSGPGSGEDPE